MVFIFSDIPHLEKGNWTIDTNINDKFQKVIIPHELIIRWKNFWGAELMRIKTNKSTTPQPVAGNQPICRKVAEYITNEFKSLEQINEELHKDGYNLHNDTDLKTVYYMLVSSKHFDDINLERNKNWEIRRIPVKPTPKAKTNLFVCKRTNVRLTNINIAFPEHWIAKRDLIISQEYADNTKIEISVDPRGFFTDISYHGHQIHEMRDLDQNLLKWALSP